MKKKQINLCLGIITLILFLFPVTSIVKAQSPYINKVYEYRPAPGQFVNELPKYEAGNTREDMNRKAEESISGENKILISLGAYGGYVVFGFDHPIVNVPGESDFKIWGNAFFAASNPNSGTSRDGGSCEPGIVMVSYDANGNGFPDDEWYELAGSEYDHSETIKNYRLTYYKPDENKVKVPMPGYPYLNDITYIKWESNQGDEGYVYRNVYHRQPYYPQWINDETLTFEGTKLADNYVDESGTGSYYVQYAYPWGYADNYPNNDDRSNFNIDRAVDADGNPVHLPGIHFVKVYTAVNQYCGWLGETSTEIMGAEDLHPDAALSAIDNIYPDENAIRLLNNPVKEILKIEVSKQQTIAVYNSSGQKILTTQVMEGINQMDCSNLPAGFYIVVSNSGTIKFIKQ
ncbi:MAG: T9SS type A sorting domain-containing protein [Candidatus Azobacteroides sp.]|nr:T9SS type A sorting domain-containing protein [Candidatus Azobacteroides sp.]